MKFGTDTGEYSSVNTLNLVISFIFKLYHFKAFDDYITLHNLSMPLTYTVTIGLFHLISIHPLWMTSEENLTPEHN